MKLESSQAEFLKELVSLPTPTGSEHAGMMLLGRHIKAATGLAPTIDVHGNLHCVLDRGAKRTVMIEGHCDEIGFIVVHVDDDGLVYLAALGGVTVPLCAAERVVIAGRNGPVNGVIGARPPHLMNAEEKKHVAKDDLRNMPCDIGASSREEALSLVAIGDSGVVDTGWRQLAGSRVSCRGFDNRVGTFAMCEAFIRMANSQCGTGCNVHYVASVQEEVGLVGGKTAAYDVAPAIGVCCDVGFATDVQKDDRKKIGDVRLGAGPILGIGPTYHRGLTDHFTKIAESQSLPIQRKAAPRGTGTCAWAMRLERGGAAVAQISIPLRYMHSPVEVIDLDDVAAVIELVAKGVCALDDSFPLLPEQP